MKKTAEDIEAINKRIQQLKSSQQIVKKKAEKLSMHHAITNAFRIGTEFIAAVLAGICIGVASDKIFGTKVIFLLVFSLFGCMAGILNVYRSAKEMDKRIQEGKD